MFRVVCDLFMRENLKFVNKLEEKGVYVQFLIIGMFRVEYLNKEKWGLVGKVIGVNKQVIEMVISNGYLFIFIFMVEIDDGQIFNVNVDVVVVEFVCVFEFLKVVYFFEKGGLFDVVGQKIFVINFDEEFDYFMFQEWVKYGICFKIKEIKEFLDIFLCVISVVIIYLGDFQKELFIDFGVGILICCGSKFFLVISLFEFKDFDVFKLVLVRDCEGFDVKEIVDKYFEYLNENDFKVYYDGDMNVFVIVFFVKDGC